MPRSIRFYKHYFLDFYQGRDQKVQRKIQYVLELIKQVERVPKKFLKHIEGTDGLYEIRVEYESNIFRIFCFFDRERVVVLFNGFHKKTSKTPKKEIEKALSLKNSYLNEENNE
jgi:phage-related protein